MAQVWEQTTLATKMIIGSKEWLEVQRTGFFDRRPPVVGELRPQQIKFKPVEKPKMTKRPNRGAGNLCVYCKRTLEARSSPSQLAATRDHFVPRSKGGKKTVLCCRQCNEIKGDLTPEEWAEFQKQIPQYWDHPVYQKYGTPFKRKRGANGTGGPQTYRGKPLSREDSLFILRKGWKAYRAKLAREPEPAPPRVAVSVPLEYPDDPDKQRGFENAYRGREWLLRVE